MKAWSVSSWALATVLLGPACGGVVDETGDGRAEIGEDGGAEGEVDVFDSPDAPRDDAVPPCDDCDGPRDEFGPPPDAADADADAEVEPDATTDGETGTESGCAHDDECDDGNPCNGTERCVGGTCASGEPPEEGAPCVTATTRGFCRRGACVPPACGNGTVDVDEECDDGNAWDGDGCDTDCTYSCHTNLDCVDDNRCTDDFCTSITTGQVCSNPPSSVTTWCDDGNACTDPDHCDGFGGCVGPARSCNDGNDCTADTCDPALPPPDGPCVHTPLPVWYYDGDHDGYGRTTVTRCAEEDPGLDWAPRGGDCADGLAYVNPGVTAYFIAPYVGEGGATSWDYNCNGSVERERTAVASGCIGGDCATCACEAGWCPSGWPAAGTTPCIGVPDCGRSGGWVVRCEWIVLDPADGGTTDDAGLDVVGPDMGTADADAGTDTDGDVGEDNVAEADDGGVRVCTPVVTLSTQACH